MSACPYANILDPDFYVTGNHQVKLQELRQQAGGPIVKIEDPLTGIPYWGGDGPGGSRFYWQASAHLF